MVYLSTEAQVRGSARSQSKVDAVYFRSEEVVVVMIMIVTDRFHDQVCSFEEIFQNSCINLLNIDQKPIVYTQDFLYFSQREKFAKLDGFFS
jgi:hypothetical protein